MKLPPHNQIPVLCRAVCKEYRKYEPSQDCYLIQRDNEQPLTTKEVYTHCPLLEKLLEGACRSY